MEENPQKNSFGLILTRGYIIGIIGIVLLTAVAGYFVVNRQTDEPTPVACTQEAKLCPDGSAVGRTGPNCEFAECPDVNPSPTPTPTPTPVPTPAAFGKSTTLAINEQVKFTDGLNVTLAEINDSRCPEGVMCIWAGELSPLLRITGGDAGKSLKEIRLGTATATSKTENGYTFVLQDATVTTATIMVTKGEEEVSLREGEREGSLLVQKIYADRVEGLNFMEYPVARDQGFPVTLRVGETASNGCTITLTLIRIQGDTATFIKQTDFNRPCPICLAQDTLIDTPSGAVAVQDMKKGMVVWTRNAAGDRVEAIVLETSKTPVPATHQMIHIILEDGRELFVSPGHPIVDGRTIGNLVADDLYDGARVVSAERVAYLEEATYDILPSGETGFYWANGVLLASTLR